MKVEKSLELMLFFWQVGLVDTFSLIKFAINTGCQYGAIVVASAAGSFLLGAVSILTAAVVSLQLIRSAKKEHYKMMQMGHANEKIIDVKYISLE